MNGQASIMMQVLGGIKMFFSDRRHGVSKVV